MPGFRSTSYQRSTVGSSGQDGPELASGRSLASRVQPAAGLLIKEVNRAYSRRQTAAPGQQTSQIEKSWSRRRNLRTRKREKPADSPVSVTKGCPASAGGAVSTDSLTPPRSIRPAMTRCFYAQRVSSLRYWQSYPYRSGFSFSFSYEISIIF